VFVTSGLLMAWSDRITGDSHAGSHAPKDAKADSPKDTHTTGGGH